MISFAAINYSSASTQMQNLETVPIEINNDISLTGLQIAVELVIGKLLVNIYLTNWHTID